MMKRIIGIILILLVCVWQGSYAQKTCVVASAEDHVPIREALIHTDNNHWARTDYRGYFAMRYQFDSATVSKPGYIKATIYLKNLPDTVFLLPQAKQIGEVTVWGKNQEHIDQMSNQISEAAREAGRNAALGKTRLLGFDLGNLADGRGRRDRKHLKKAEKIFKEMDKKDPVVEAYKQATGKSTQLSAPAALSAKQRDEEKNEK